MLMQCHSGFNQPKLLDGIDCLGVDNLYANTKHYKLIYIYMATFCDYTQCDAMPQRLRKCEANDH